MLKYGEDYPDSCPPSEANEVEGSFYRICNSAVPEKDDFKTHVDLGLNFPPQKLCEAKALSFFASEQAIERLKKRFPKFKDKVAVLINILPSHGVGLLEGEHLNLWEFQDVNFLDAQEGGLENE
ncbi:MULTISPECIES: hypothetical protein [Streptococcus]|uniref:hypothetical protein n=1 Tax=Streptococcus TaxID=1301 RepID=UPI000234A69C|nr:MULTISPECIES: hypothetical protein [Streptococcus]EHI75837.1 hypothetical protein HMPREF9184_01743 [Streptococcus sp. oral taxon 058 str. F0407]